VAEISGLGGGLAFHEISDPGENQDRGELRRHDEGLANTQIIELEFIELAWRR
jgi:hypothetical protein